MKYFLLCMFFPAMICLLPACEAAAQVPSQGNSLGRYDRSDGGRSIRVYVLGNKVIGQFDGPPVQCPSRNVWFTATMEGEFIPEGLQQAVFPIRFSGDMQGCTDPDEYRDEFFRQCNEQAVWTSQFKGKFVNRNRIELTKTTEHYKGEIVDGEPVWNCEPASTKRTVVTLSTPGMPNVNAPPPIKRATKKTKKTVDENLNWYNWVKKLRPF